MLGSEKIYRQNAAVIVTDGNGHVLLCERIEPRVVQTVQGGIDAGESAFNAACRELEEELGIGPNEYKMTESLIETYTYEWDDLVKKKSKKYHGQRQHFFLAKVDPKTTFNLSKYHPEFSRVWWGTPEEMIERAWPVKRPGIEAAINAFKKHY